MNELNRMNVNEHKRVFTNLNKRIRDILFMFVCLLNKLDKQISHRIIHEQIVECLVRL